MTPCAHAHTCSYEAPVSGIKLDCVPWNGLVALFREAEKCCGNIYLLLVVATLAEISWGCIFPVSTLGS